jgi:hypothetical protein
MRLQRCSATRDANAEVNVEPNVEPNAVKEETEEREDDRGRPISAPGVPDVNTRQIHTRRVATTAPENERTATPAGETTADGTGIVATAATADAEILMTDQLDVSGTETCSRRNRGEKEAATASASAMATGRGKNGKEPRALHARGSLHPI